METGLARNTDPDTSHEAALSVNVATLEAIIYDTIKARGSRGATWDEIYDILKAKGFRFAKASISPRFKPLRRKKLIGALVDEYGFVQKRLGECGRDQTIWVAT